MPKRNHGEHDAWRRVFVAIEKQDSKHASIDFTKCVAPSGCTFPDACSAALVAEWPSLSPAVGEEYAVVAAVGVAAVGEASGNPGIDSDGVSIVMMVTMAQQVMIGMLVIAMMLPIAGSRWWL